MKNLAGHPEGTDEECKKELEDAGINVVELPQFAVRGEVKSKYLGTVGPWSFERAWYYWIAEGPGLPPDVADKLHEKFGQDVRVAGHCGCPSPREWYKGFAVPLYHVDTQEGLSALSAALKSVMNDPVIPKEK